MDITEVPHGTQYTHPCALEPTCNSGSLVSASKRQVARGQVLAARRYHICPFPPPALPPGPALVLLPGTTDTPAVVGIVCG
jgi:hypothetical protein